MENEQVNVEGLAVGQEAPESDNAPGGDSSPVVPGETLEEAYERILLNHEQALQGMAQFILELAGRVKAVEDYLSQPLPEPEQPEKSKNE